MQGSRASQDALLANQTAGSMRAVFAPKVSGALGILSTAAALPLQSVVLFSSVAGQLGSAGQVNYGAANAVLDAIGDTLHAQASLIYPVLSVTALKALIKSQCCQLGSF